MIFYRTILTSLYACATQTTLNRLKQPKIFYSVLVLSTSIFITFSGVTIGFNIAKYSVSEGVGSVSAIVSVLSGTLARDVSVRVFTSDDSATSEGGCTFTTSC